MVEVVFTGDAAGLRDLESGEVLTDKKTSEGQGWFCPPDAGKTRTKVPLKPHSCRAFKKE